MNLLDVLLCQTTFLLLLLSMHLTYNVDYTVTSIIIILSLYYYSLISLLYWLTRWNKNNKNNISGLVNVCIAMKRCFSCSIGVYMYVCMVITYYSRVWINRLRLPILLVVS